MVEFVLGRRPEPPEAYIQLLLGHKDVNRAKRAKRS